MNVYSMVCKMANKILFVFWLANFLIKKTNCQTTCTAIEGLFRAHYNNGYADLHVFLNSSIDQIIIEQKSLNVSTGLPPAYFIASFDSASPPQIYCGMGCYWNGSSSNVSLILLPNATSIDGIILYTINYQNGRPQIPSYTTSSCVSGTDNEVDKCICCNGELPSDFDNCTTYAPTIDPYGANDSQILVTVSAPLPFSFNTTTAPLSTTTSSESLAPTTTESDYDDDVNQITINCTDPSGDYEQFYCNMGNMTDEQIEFWVNDTTTNLKPNELNHTAIYQLSGVVDKLSSKQNVTPAQFNSVSNLIDKMLDIPHSSMQEANSNGQGTSQRILLSIHNLTSNTHTEVKYLTGKNMGLSTHFLNCTDPNNITGGNGFSDHGDSFAASTSGNPRHSIVFDLKSLCDANAKKFYYAMYRDPKLFVTSISNQTSRTNTTTRTSSILTMRKTTAAHFFSHTYIESNPNTANIFGMIPSQDTQPPATGERCNLSNFFSGGNIMGGNIIDSLPSSGKFDQLPQGTNTNPIKATLKYSKNFYTKPLHGTLGVNTFSPKTAFSINPCGKISEDGENFHATCSSIDTHFALLNNGSLTDPRLCSSAINVLSPLLNSSSMIAMLLAILGYLSKTDRAPAAMKKLDFIWDKVAYLKIEATDILTNGSYNATMVAFYFFYTIFGDRRRLGGSMDACTVMAGINYWLMLSSIFLTMVESLSCIKKFHWNGNIFNKILDFVSTGFSSIALAYGASSTLVIIFTIAIRKFYKRADDFCWVRPDYTTAAISFPLAILCASGAFCYGLIILQKNATSSLCNYILRFVFRFKEGDFTRAEELNKDPEKFSNSLSRLGISQIALALPFIFEHLATYTSKISIFHYLFTVILGSQGIQSVSINALYFESKLEGISSEAKTVQDNIEKKTNIGPGGIPSKISTEDTKLAIDDIEKNVNPKLGQNGILSEAKSTLVSNGKDDIFESGLNGISSFISSKGTKSANDDIEKTVGSRSGQEGPNSTLVDNEKTVPPRSGLNGILSAGTKPSQVDNEKTISTSEPEFYTVEDLDRVNEFIRLSRQLSEGVGILNEAENLTKENLQKTMSQQAKGVAKKLKWPRRAVSNLVGQNGIVDKMVSSGQNKMEALKNGIGNLEAMKEEIGKNVDATKSKVEGKFATDFEPIAKTLKNFEQNGMAKVNEIENAVDEFDNGNGVIDGLTNGLGHLTKNQPRFSQPEYPHRFSQPENLQRLSLPEISSNKFKNYNENYLVDPKILIDEDHFLELVIERLQNFINRHGYEEEKKKSNEIFDELEEFYRNHQNGEIMYAKLEELCYGSSFSTSLRSSHVVDNFAKILLEAIRKETIYDV